MDCYVILQNSNLPWIEPGKALSFDLGNLTDAIGDAIGVCISTFHLKIFYFSLYFYKLKYFLDP